MQTLMNIVGSLTQNKLATATGVWPVWRDSVRSEVVFKPVPRQHAKRLWFAARRWDQRTHEPHRHGGIIGRAAMAVLYTLVHDFLNWRTGRLDPAIAAIARKSSLCERTCYSALKRLRELGLINWTRRCESTVDDAGRFILKQRTNAYELGDQQRWIGHVSDDPPPLSPDLLGAPQRVPEVIEQAAAAIITGDRHDVYRALTLDPNDPLALALASFGRTLGHI